MSGREKVQDPGQGMSRGVRSKLLCPYLMRRSNLQKQCFTSRYLQCYASENNLIFKETVVIFQMVSAWEETPVHHLRFDVRSLLQDAVITEVRAHQKRL